MCSLTKEDNRTYTRQTKKCNFVNNQIRCSNDSIEGEYFCQNHYLFLNKNNLSGSEIKYQPREWNHPYIQYSTNCYDYLLNNKTSNNFNTCQDYCYQSHKEGCPKKTEKCRTLMKQPENISNNKKLNCQKIYKDIQNDVKDMYKTNYNTKCKEGYYKAASVIHPKKTYHFYRQNLDGSWSHKPGSDKVTNLDASGNTIIYPHLADRNYSYKPNKINYSKFCDYFCLKK